ncbi:Sulfoxide reductase heme-binding subunit YedZ [uncultured archaeon]|nr:Sulfoxide reductase heme-binding subunit YedZ [uncultured archaeon]
MQKSSFLFLLLLTGAALIAAYQTTLTQDPNQAMVRAFGLTGFFILCVSLIIGPLVVFNAAFFAPILEPRRAVGIAAFVFAALHVVLMAGPYFGYNIAGMLALLPLQLGAIVLVLLVALTLTSCDWAQKKLGTGLWKNIQRVNYVVFVLTLAHFIFSANGLNLSKLNLSEGALVLLAVITILLQLAGAWVRHSRKTPPPQAAEKQVN